MLPPFFSRYLRIKLFAVKAKSHTIKCMKRACKDGMISAKRFLDFCKIGDAESVEAHIPNVDPEVFKAKILNNAIWGGSNKIVLCLLKDGRIDPAASDNEAYFMAYILKRCKIENTLLGDSRVCNTVLSSMMRLRRLDIILHLLSDFRVKVESAHVEQAILSGDLHIIKHFLNLNRVFVTMEDNKWLIWAHENKKDEIFNLLLTDFSVQHHAMISAINHNCFSLLRRLDFAKYPEIVRKALEHAIQKSNVEAVSIIIEKYGAPYFKDHLDIVRTSILQSNFEVVHLLFSKLKFSKEKLLGNGLITLYVDAKPRYDVLYYLLASSVSLIPIELRVHGNVRKIQQLLPAKSAEEACRTLTDMKTINIACIHYAPLRLVSKNFLIEQFLSDTTLHKDLFAKIVSFVTGLPTHLLIKTENMFRFAPQANLPIEFKEHDRIYFSNIERFAAADSENLISR